VAPGLTIRIAARAAANDPDSYYPNLEVVRTTCLANQKAQIVITNYHASSHAS